MPVETRTYDSLPHWRRVNAALPTRLKLEEPLEVREDWLKTGGFEVHLDRWMIADARATVILTHGAGGNGRMLGLYGLMCNRLGFNAVAPDLPGYGLTQQSSKRDISYDDWRDVLSAVVEVEARHGTPVALFGLSMGGMLAYDAASLTRAPKALMATCLMEPRDPATRRAMARWPWMANLIEPLLCGAPALTDSVPVLMRLSSNMDSITNLPRLTRAIVADPRAGGNWMPARFLRTFLTSTAVVAPEKFDVCPVLLAHPAADRWTDVSLSQLFFARLNKVQTEFVMLENGGHFPVEAPAHEQLQAAIGSFVGRALESVIP